MILITLLWVGLLMKSWLIGQAAADAKYYGNVEAYNVLKARGAKIPVTTRTPDFFGSWLRVFVFHLIFNCCEFSIYVFSFILENQKDTDDCGKSSRSAWVWT